ncbi:MAG: hypothetical protein JWM47_3598 [Acidimicrobiales bacterium]|nr:hypothetical protein [Acidimicrobiales bacterium]
MSYPGFLAHELVDLVRDNRSWMTWNLILAVVPAVLAVALFARPRRRGRLWWAGVVAFVLFLPNAPYVVTDLVHLGPDADRVDSRGVLLTGIIPLYAAFVIAGFLAYVLCTELVLRAVREVQPTVPRGAVEVTVHLVSTLGIVLGRIGRLNSWDTVTRPATTLELTFNTLTLERAPVALVTVFVAVAVVHLVVRTVVFSGARALDGLRRTGTRPTLSSDPGRF